jgi:spore cortex biosynthesis protein YabQ
VVFLINFVSEQVYVFLATLYGGFIIGFIYDLYRIFRCVFEPKRIATLIEDLIFWIVISITAVVVLLFSNNGQLRFYTFLGFAAGVILYSSIFSKYIIKIIMILLRTLKKIICKIIKLLLYPLQIAIFYLKRPWYGLKKRLRPIYYRCKKWGSLPKRLYQEMIKYIKLIRKKK